MTKGMLFVVVSILLGLAIWFLGPMLHLGQATPLLEAGTRIAAILLMLALMLFVFLRWPISILGVTALCLLIWFGSPLVKFGDSSPFEPIWVRVLIVVVIAAVFLALLVKYYWNTLINNQDFVQKYLMPKEAEEGDEQILPVATELEHKFHHALEQLNELKVNKSLLHKLLAWNQYRYELPWYMLLGAQDSGKTTLALNSGLAFPQNPPIDIDYLEGLPATVDCDWWLSNSAVLIDPSGKFAAQDVLSEQPLNEWKTLLGLLREHRPRTPINGVLLALSVQDLIETDIEDLRKHAARLRLRMDEMRKKMEILFPVYLLVTKTDTMRGFNEYFAELSIQGKEQVWGFTLPHQAQGKINADQIKTDIRSELGALTQQLEHHLNQRLNEELSSERRAKLYAFADEFRSLEQKIAVFTSQLLVESKFDDTQQLTMLRGVYFTSAVQTALKDILANRQTLVERLKKRFSRGLAVVNPENDWDKAYLPSAVSEAEQTFSSIDESADVGDALALAESGDSTSTAISAQTTANAVAMPKPRHRLSGAERYFLHHLFGQLILSEAHLVRPNLRWEYQNRLKKIFGNTVMGLGFIGLLVGMLNSMYHNKSYLKSVADKTTALEQKIDQYQSNPNSDLIPAILDASETLPRYSTLKLDDPSWDYRFGLYTGAEIKEVSEKTYHQLQDSLLLPYINQRLETVMVDGLRDKNSEKAYNALRVYLLLHDAKRYAEGGNASDVRDWVHKDVDTHDVGADFSGNAAVGSHIKAMFDGKRAIQIDSRVNSDLVAQVRLFLNSSPPTQRLYDRAKGSMLQDAPSDISLQSILGDKAVQIFALKDGKTIDKGVSGIYTVEGYKRYFGLKLLEFVKRAQKDDAWVMGQTDGGALAEAQETAEALAEQFNSPQMREIRKLYLTEYARAWQDFVNNIQLAPDTSGGMGGFAYELNTAKALVSADSPLSKLLRTIVKETSPTAINAPVQNNSTNAVDNKVTELQTSAAELQKNAQALGKLAGVNDLKLERELVEAPFAALREIVTGSPYVAGDPAAQMVGTNSSPVGKLSLDNANAMIGEYYNALVTIDNATRTGAAPANIETFSKLKLEADKYPAPVSNILATLGQGGQRKLTLLTGEALNRQFQEQVGQFCWQTMAGRYPFDRNSMNEVLPDDFANLFGPNGLYNQFFQKNLASIVETNVRPWRYKLQADGSPMMGPSLDSFEQATQIRQQFFNGGGMDGAAGTRMSLRMNVAVTTMDPDIAQLMINMDGQGQRYAHGPVVPLSFTWPGARGGTAAEILAESLTGGNLPTVGATGPWALFRLIDKAKARSEIAGNRLSVRYELGGRAVMLEFSTQGSSNPLTSNILQTFNCPRAQSLALPSVGSVVSLPAAPAGKIPASDLPINPKTGKPLTVSP